MAANPQCIGNCRICTVLGACPADTLVCEDCGEEIEPGEEIELEVETYERGRRDTKNLIVKKNVSTKGYIKRKKYPMLLLQFLF